MKQFRSDEASMAREAGNSTRRYYTFALTALVCLAGGLLIAGSAGASHGKLFVDSLLDQGYTAVIVTPDGAPVPDREIPGRVYYLSYAEHAELFESDAPIVVDDVILDPRAIIASGDISTELAEMLGKHTVASSDTTGDWHTTRPYRVNNAIIIWTLAAQDATHAPGSVNTGAVSSAADSFRTNYGGTWTSYGVYSNCWDASGIGNDVWTLVQDLKAEQPVKCSWFGTSTYPQDVVIGWVKEGSNNGVAYKDANGGPYALGAETRPWGVDWAHSAIAGHEISHLFSAAHDAANCVQGIMDYCYAANRPEGGYFYNDADNNGIMRNNLDRNLNNGAWHQDSDHPAN